MRIIGTAAVLATVAGAATAGGIDRSGQNIGILFEKDRVVELSFGRVMPEVEGRDVAAFGGGSSGNIADDYSQFALSYKQDITDRLSFAVILDQPFGADVVYGSGSVALGGTSAYAESVALTGLARYKFTDNFSAHGGLRVQRASGQIGLRGLAYGGLNGYAVDLDDDTALGYVIGAAYEQPDIALRVALTYNSKITHEFDTVETLGPTTIAAGGTTEVDTPESYNLDFQTGIAADTLLFGQIRWVHWSQFQISPAAFDGAVPGDNSSLVDVDNTTTYMIGVGRRFSDTWSGSVSYTYEPKTGDDLISPLAPTNGRRGITLAAVYTADAIRVTTGINYSWLGDADAATGGTARSEFRDNTSLGIGVRVAYTF